MHPGWICLLLVRTRPVDSPAGQVAVERVAPFTDTGAPTQSGHLHLVRFMRNCPARRLPRALILLRNDVAVPLVRCGLTTATIAHLSVPLVQRSVRRGWVVCRTPGGTTPGGLVLAWSATPGPCGSSRLARAAAARSWLAHHPRDPLAIPGRRCLPSMGSGFSTSSPFQSMGRARCLPPRVSGRGLWSLRAKTLSAIGPKPLMFAPSLRATAVTPSLLRYDIP